MKKSVITTKSLALFASAATVLCLVAPAAAHGAEEADKPLIHYSFDTPTQGSTIPNEGSAADAAGTVNGSAAIANGQLALKGDAYVSVPTTALTDREDITVSVWLKNNFGKGNTVAAYIGNADTQKGYFLLNPANLSGYVKSVMTKATAAASQSSPWNTETGPGATSAAASGAKSTSDMALYTTVIQGSTGSMSFYLNGEPVGEKSYSVPQGGLKNYGDLVAFIGKSAFPDRNDIIDVDDYAVYGTALSAQTVSDLYTGTVFDKAVAQVSVPQRAEVDFTLPVTSVGVPISWESDNKAIEIKDGQATVTRPSASSADAKVTLTATFTHGSKNTTKKFEVTVPRLKSTQETVREALDSYTIHNANNMRGNFSLPLSINSVPVTWTVTDAGTTDAKLGEGVNKNSQTVQVKRPQAGQKAQTVTLTAVAEQSGESYTKTFKVTVQPLPSAQETDEAYVWAFFTGEGVGGEKISLAASQGNNALTWNTLNKGVPLFTSTEGEKGLRDPFIFKTKDGDKFYLIATDLKISGRSNSAGGLKGFAGSQADGSRAIEIWESDDLVNWSNQRHVTVSTEYAGNTWAPEAYWDAELGKYVVYWASNLYDSTDLNKRTALTYNRMMAVTTDDFVNFSEPMVWIDSQRGNGKDGLGSIDVTVQKEGDTYYRVYKDERSMTLRQEKSTNLMATVKGQYPSADGASTTASDEWSLVGEKIGHGQDNGYGGKFTAGEGPMLFKANKGDANGYQYYLFADQPNYHGGPNHYVPMATRDISKASEWKVIGSDMPEVNFPTNSDGGKPRHGTVLPVTRSQYEKVLAAYAPEVAVKDVEETRVSVKVGENPTGLLPSSVKLTKQDGSQEDADVKWEAVDKSLYAKAGEFTIQGVAADKSRKPVTAVVTVEAEKESEPEPKPEPGEGEGEKPEEKPAIPKPTPKPVEKEGHKTASPHIKSVMAKTGVAIVSIAVASAVMIGCAILLYGYVMKNRYKSEK